MHSPPPPPLRDSGEEEAGQGGRGPVRRRGEYREGSVLKKMVFLNIKGNNSEYT